MKINVLPILFKYNLSDDEILSMMFKYKYGYKYDILKNSGKCRKVGSVQTAQGQPVVPAPPSAVSARISAMLGTLVASMGEERARVCAGHITSAAAKWEADHCLAAPTPPAPVPSTPLLIRCHHHKDVNDSKLMKIIKNGYQIYSITYGNCSGLSPEAQAEIDFIDSLSSNLSEKISEEKKKLWIDEYNSLKEEREREILQATIDYRNRQHQIALKREQLEREQKELYDKKYNDTYNMLMASFTK